MITVWYDKCTTPLQCCISSLLFSSVMMMSVSVPVLAGVGGGFVHGKLGGPAQFKQNHVWFRSLVAAVHWSPADKVLLRKSW